jgi:hypothetical protein
MKREWKRGTEKGERKKGEINKTGKVLFIFYWGFIDLLIVILFIFNIFTL